MKKMTFTELKDLLDEEYELHNRPSFIECDPIQIPHAFSKREDIEIAAFLTAQIAWGRRKMIIANASRLMHLMDNAPYDFVTGAKEPDLVKLDKFVHRTFSGGDCVTAVKSLQHLCSHHGSLGDYFEKTFAEEKSLFATLAAFRRVFLETDHDVRFNRHISDVTRKSAAKRLNLLLMWMCRNDGRGVHFGLWKIPPSALMIPLDVHCGNVGRQLGLLNRKQNDWPAVEELTAALRVFDPDDPVKYDFALFGMGVLKRLCG